MTFLSGVGVRAPRLRAHAAARGAVAAAAAEAARRPRPGQDQVARRLLHQEPPRAAPAQVRAPGHCGPSPTLLHCR